MSYEKIEVSDGLTINVSSEEILVIYTRGIAEDEVTILKNEIPDLIQALQKAIAIVSLGAIQKKEEVAMENWVNRKPTKALDPPSRIG